MILGDDRAQLSGTSSYGEVTNDVGADGLWRRRKSSVLRETFRLEGAHIFSDRWQVGFSVPIMRQSYHGQSSSGLGDLVGVIGYEALPVWDFSPWRPRGHVFLQVTAPGGSPSPQDSEADYQLDSHGRGFYSLGAGAIFTKVVGRWDISASLDIHRSLPKNFKNSQTNGRVTPGYGGNLGIGGGWNLQRLRLGLLLIWTYEDPLVIDGEISSVGAAERFATARISTTYLFPAEWSVIAAVSDQTWIGNPVNTSLGQDVTVSLRKTWMR